MRDIATVHRQLINALGERDAWQSVDAVKYEMASMLVEGLQKELAELTNGRESRTLANLSESLGKYDAK